MYRHMNGIFAFCEFCLPYNGHAPIWARCYHPAQLRSLAPRSMRRWQHVTSESSYKTHFTPPTPNRQNCFVASAVWTELATVFSSFQYIGDWPVLSSLVGGVNTFSQLVVTQFPNDVTVHRHSRPGPTSHVLGNNVVQYCCRWFFHA